MPLVERRYAEALVDIAFQKGDIEGFQSQLGDMVEIVDRQPELKFFLLNPELKPDVKKQVIEKIFSQVLKPELLSFIKLLLDKDRIKVLQGIYEDFVRLADKRKNILDMKIVSAAPLDETQIGQIKEKYKSIYQANSVKTAVEIDASLIGGVKVIIGDKVIDGSVKGRLESLRTALMK